MLSKVPNLSGLWSYVVCRREAKDLIHILLSCDLAYLVCSWSLRSLASFWLDFVIKVVSCGKSCCVLFCGTFGSRGTVEFLEGLRILRVVFFPY